MSETDIPAIVRIVTELMYGFPAQWCIAGGWAIDLFLGRETRQHADLELAIFREDQVYLHKHFSDWMFQRINDGHCADWSAGETLLLPIHEIHARSKTHAPFALEFLLNERTADDWVFRRNPSIGMQLSRAICYSDRGGPFLNPAIVLLFKAKIPRAKDELDFQVAQGRLDHDDRRWLRTALKVCHPQHHWLSVLDD